MNEVDLEFFEKNLGFLFMDTIDSRINRDLVKMYPSPEVLLILVYAYEKFGGLIPK